MPLYSLMLFIHVSAAICLFIGFSVWLFGITAMAHATRVEQVRTLADLMLMVRLVVPGSALLVIVAGLTMTLLSWGLQTGWIAVALASLFLIGPIGTWVIDPKVRAIAALAQTLPDGPLSSALAEHTADRFLRVTMHTLIGMLFGIIFLMTTKPALTSAIGALIVAACLGCASGILAVRAKGTARSDRLHQQDEAS